MDTKILVVDDEAMVLKTFPRALGAGYEVVAVASAEEALAKLATEQFDAVVTDTNLGVGMWGPDFLAQVATRWPHMGRVIMSGFDRKTAEGALESGAAHVFMAKPWDMGQPAMAILQAMDKAAEARSACAPS